MTRETQIQMGSSASAGQLVSDRFTGLEPVGWQSIYIHLGRGVTPLPVVSHTRSKEGYASMWLER